MQHQAHGDTDADYSYDYAIHSDYLIHWTGKDIDGRYDARWMQSDKSKTTPEAEREYLRRLKDILTYGLWMTTEPEQEISGTAFIPATAKCCFTELKISESRKHAKQYGRLGIGVKRPFVFERHGRPLAYYGYGDPTRDKFLQACASDLKNKDLLNFFKPMNSSRTLNYDFYGESEWRIVFLSELLTGRKIIDPRDKSNEREHQYYKSLRPDQQEKLKYLIPLDGWLSVIIYPSLQVKNRAQQDPTTSVAAEIKKIKARDDHANRVEKGNLPIEVNLDACRNF